MQCPSCHHEASGAFCNFCGASLTATPAGTAPAGAAPGVSAAAAPAIPATATGGGLSENAAAAIAYLTIIPSILFLVLDPYRRMPLVRFHSIQNLLFAAAWIIVWIAISILEVALHFIPFITILFMVLNLIVAVGFFVGWLLALIKASQGKWFKLPFIGEMATKMANNQ
jgi:uncharacterized membrane protein